MSLLKRIIASLFLLFFSFSVFAKPSWYKKESSWHSDDAKWYIGETSWYSYEYHWKTDGIKLDNQKEFVNELSKFIVSKVKVSEAEKEKKLKRIYAKALQKFAIGTVVIVVEVVLYTYGGPAVSAIALCSLKGSTSMAVSGALAGGVASIFYPAIEDDDFDTIIAKSIDSVSGGYMVGAIIGGTIGGVSEYNKLKSQTINGLKLNDVARISKETGWPSSLIKEFQSVDQYEICRNSRLQYVDVGGRGLLIPPEINLNFTDEFGRTNLQRMQSGLAALDKSGKSYELHHLGQRMDSPLAVLSQAQHRGKLNYSIWHETSKDYNSKIDREIFGEERADIWRALSKIYFK